MAACEGVWVEGIADVGARVLSDSGAIVLAGEAVAFLNLFFGALVIGLTGERDAVVGEAVPGV